MQGEGQEVAWCACRVGAVRTEGRRAGACTHVARARDARIASISHFRAGWDGDGGRVVVRAAVVRLRAKKTVTMVRAAMRKGW